MYAIDYDTGVRLQDAPVAIGTAIEGDCEVRFEIFNEYLFDTATAFEFTHRCVDPGAPDGYGDEIFGGITTAVGGQSGSVGGPFVSGTLRVRFNNNGFYYDGNWLVPKGLGGWFAYRLPSPGPFTFKWFFVSIASNGTKSDPTVLPKIIITGNDQEVSLNTVLEFTLDGAPYSPPYENY